MPEAPDLVVIREFLEPRLVSRRIVAAEERKPLVLRNMTGEPFSMDIAGRRITGIGRKGKLLIFEISVGAELAPPDGGGAGTARDPGAPGDSGGAGRSGAAKYTGGASSARTDRLLVISPMLTGGLRYCPPKTRMEATAILSFDIDDGMQLRYFDEKRMGQVYYLRPAQREEIVRLENQGPDVIDEPLSFEAFKLALKPFTGEIKGVLTRGYAVSGIGNAYADEVLFAAGIYPYKKRPRLRPEELKRLHAAVYSVPKDAVHILRERVGENIHKKIRDFLKVHGKGGQPCPACGNLITSITAHQRETNYCRRCQPGSLFTR